MNLAYRQLCTEEDGQSVIEELDRFEKQSVDQPAEERRYELRDLLERAGVIPLGVVVATPFMTL
jgi:hypothetical protein